MMNIRRLLSSCVLVLLQLASPIPSHAAPQLEDQMVTYEDALTLYQKHEWSRAYGQFSRLAGSDHQESARITLFMLQHGPQLYATALSASQAQIVQWMRVSKTSMDLFAADGGD